MWRRGGGAGCAGETGLNALGASGALLAEEEVPLKFLAID